MEAEVALFCTGGVVLLRVMSALANALRLIPEWQRLDVYRMGRDNGR